MASTGWGVALKWVLLGEAAMVTLLGINHVAAMWVLRRNFFIAVRCERERDRERDKGTERDLGKFCHFLSCTSTVRQKERSA